MYKILTYLTLGFIVYTLYHDNTSRQSPATPDRREAENVGEDLTNGSLSVAKGNIPKIGQDHESPIKESMEANRSKGFIERILTDSMSQYLQTNNGQKLAKELIRSNNSHPPVKYSIINSTNSLKRKYDITPILDGLGETTVCGEKVEINYKIIDKHQKIVTDSTERFVIGQHKIPELNILSIGMKRNEVMSSKYLSDNTGDKKSRIQIALNDIFTPLEFETRKIKIFDDYFSENSVVACYNQVKFNLDIFTINGRLLNRQNLTFYVGSDNYPQVLSYILTNKPNIGVRTVIMPGKYLTHHTNSLVDLDIIKDEYVLVEVSEIAIIPNQ